MFSGVFDDVGSGQITSDVEPQQQLVNQDITNLHQGCHNRVPEVASATTSTSRRKPILRREKETQSLTLERLKTLMKANTHAKEEHDIQMQIIQLKLQAIKRDNLRVRHESIKLEILEL